MKTNHIYIIAAIIIVVLGIVLFGGDKTPEVNDETTNTPTETTTNTPTPSPSSNTSSVKKPTPPPSVSKPLEAPVPELVPSIPTAASLQGSIFRMISYNGSSIPADAKYTVTFDNGKLSAKFCNNMSGNFVLDGSLLKVNNLTGTLMYCGVPSNLMEIESSFTSMLNFGAQIYRSGNTIIISSSNKGAVMVFSGF